MILAGLCDSFLRDVVRRAASPDEDVFWEEERVLDALDRGFPRLIVQGPDGPGYRSSRFGFHDRVPVLRLPRSTLEAWEESRRSHDVPPRKAEFFADRLRGAIRRNAGRVPWIEGTFRDLTLAVGIALPGGVRGMGRRIMEYPAFYRTLGPLAQATGYSPGSLKARFRRRGLESPSTYLRWFRAVAVVQVLTKGGAPYREAAHRLGFSGSANLCRFLESTTELTPGQLTEVEGRERLLIRFVSRLLLPKDLRAWEDLDRVFLRRVA